MMSKIPNSAGNGNGYRISEALPEGLKVQLAALFREEGERLLREHTALRPLMSLRDVARTLGCSSRTVETLLATQELPPALWIGGTRKWSPEAIDAYIRSREGHARRSTRRGRQ